MRVYGALGIGAELEGRCCESICVQPSCPSGPNALDSPAAARRKKVRRVTSWLRRRTHPSKLVTRAAAQEIFLMRARRLLFLATAMLGASGSASCFDPVHSDEV